MNKINFNLKYLLYFFILFPFVGFVNGIDTQPFYILFSLLIIVYNIHKYTIDYNILFFVFLLTISIILSFLFTEVDFNYILESLLFPLSFILIYILIDNNLLKITVKSLNIVALIYILIGCIQLFFPNFLIFLTSRTTENIGMLINSGRGVRSLTGEPSHFGKILIVINLFYIYLYHYSNELKFKTLIYYCIFLFLSNLILSQSAFSISYHSFLLLIYFLCIHKKYILLNSLIIICLLFTLQLIISYYFSNTRFYKIYFSIFYNTDFIKEQGAFRRLYNYKIAINNFFYYFPLGTGNSNLKYSTYINTIFGKYSYYASNNVLGGYISLLLKYGIFSFSFFLFYFYSLFQIFVTNYKKEFLIRIFLVVSIFIITFLDSSIINPFYLIFYLYIYINRSNFIHNVN
jgi:hypothetical protein